MKLYEGKKVTVAGLGTHGGAVGNIRWLHEQGARLTVTDLKSEEELRESLNELRDLTDITWVLGEHRMEDFIGVDMVVRNPAMPRKSEFLEAAREAHVPVEMDSSLFFKHSPTKLIVGVTGSKGKTTTTRAIAHLLQLTYGRVVTLGVEQTSPLAALPDLRDGDMVVFELSSWRLEGLDEHRLSPHTAIITSLYRDHLNTYDSFEEYCETKKSIFRHQTVDDRVLLNYDDELIQSWRDEVRGRVAWFSLESHVPEEGICVQHDVISLLQHNTTIPLFNLEALPFESNHERRNLLPAIYLAFCNSVRVESIKLHLQHLTRAPHRLERVATINGVLYINDSAATIPDATIAALEAFRDRHIVLILGGSDKKLQFEDLARRLRDFRIRSFIFLPGNATEAMRREVVGAYEALPPIHDAQDMEEAVRKAQEVAYRGDVVLLSPGATSFGLFKHEFDRGEKFKEVVEQLR